MCYVQSLVSLSEEEEPQAKRKKLSHWSDCHVQIVLWTITPQIPHTYHTHYTYILIYYIMTLYITFWCCIYYFCRVARLLLKHLHHLHGLLSWYTHFTCCRSKQQTDYCLLTCFMAILLSLCLGISSLLCNTFYQLMITRKKKNATTWGYNAHA